MSGRGKGGKVKGKAKSRSSRCWLTISSKFHFNYVLSVYLNLVQLA